jgi:hypothetical protein
MKIRKWVIILRSSSYDKRRPKDFILASQVTSQSSSDQIEGCNPSGHRLILPGMVAMYFEVRAILQSANFQVSEKTIVQLCFTVKLTVNNEASL